jgi:hypothetical protein
MRDVIDGWFTIIVIVARWVGLIVVLFFIAQTVATLNDPEALADVLGPYIEAIQKEAAE